MAGSIRRPRRSKPRRTSAARARRGNPVVFGASIKFPRAGNAEAYYPHFQFDSNYTYGMVHRE